MMISNKEGGAPPCAHTSLFATHPPRGEAPKTPVNSPLLIGTSGYDYPEWKGVFYPQDLKRKDFLSYYATQFNALELNNTFYNMPTADRLLSFYERSGGLLQFSIKANRLLTHEIDRNWQAAAADFKAAVTPLAQKDSLCSLLFQFPQSFHYTDENRIYLAKLIAEFQGLPIVIEFRHVEWIKESVLHGLEERQTSLCFCDMPQLKALPDGKTIKAPFIGPTAYIRLHGRNADAWYSTEISQKAATASLTNGSSRYTYDYSDDELSEFVPVIKAAVLSGKKPVVFFNNHPNGSGANNAKKLKELL
ncbi:MAG: DUF72 domain-containing protein [Treponema sp.]|nr:DUF72 domain-containing protein [Treponema sp.]